MNVEIKKGRQVNSVNVKYFSDSFDLKKAHKSDSGYDIKADTTSNVNIEPHTFKSIDTGVSLNLPTNVEGQIRSRSGLAEKLGVVVLNSPGTIDQGYRGKIKVILINHGETPFLVKKGDCIAQIVFCKTLDTEVIRATKGESLDLSTERGINGFGSSDTKTFQKLFRG